MSKFIAALCVGAIALGFIEVRAAEGDKSQAAETPKDKATIQRVESATSKSAPADLKTKQPVGDFWTSRERAMTRPTDPRYLPKDKERAKPTPAQESKEAP